MEISVIVGKMILIVGILYFVCSIKIKHTKFENILLLLIKYDEIEVLFSIQVLYIVKNMWR